MQALEVLVAMEHVGLGLQLSSVDKMYYGLSMNDVYGMLVADGITYLVLALYLEKVIQGQWGTSLPW